MSNYIQDPNDPKKQIPGPPPDNYYSRTSAPTTCTLTKTPNYYASFQSHEKIDILNGIKPRPQVSFDPDHLSVQCFVGGPKTDQLVTRNNDQLEYIQYLNNVKVHRLPEEIFTYNNKFPFNTLELAMLKNTPIPQFKELLELNND